ncbi:MAG: isoprenylcysteine carboxylmethyltransferase family protein [Polyangiaceae bacterium]
MSQRMSFPVAMMVAFVLVFVVPTVRMRLRGPHWGLVTKHDADPLQPVVATSLFALVAGALALAVAHAALGPERLGVFELPPFFEWVGWTAAIAGVLFVMVAQANMGASFRIGIERNGRGSSEASDGIDRSRTALVEHGLYSVIRNPIYAGLFVALGGLVLVAPSPWSIMGVALVVQVVCIQVRAEEMHLAAVHGEAFIRYARRVGRFFPWVGRYSSAAGSS